MKILVAYATKHGSTRGIAERTAATLERRGLDVTLRPVSDAGDAGDFDAYIIGSAAYMFHWLGVATAFVRRHGALLATRPVWLFSSGPLGSDEVDNQGEDVRAAAEPKEFAEFRESIRPRELRIFFGAYDPDAPPAGLMERLTRMMPAARDALPAGDFRDWAEIDAWAGAIALDLTTVAAPTTAAG